MSSRERVRAITGWLLTESPSTSIAEIADRLQVSPATVSNDLQKVKTVSYTHLDVYKRQALSNTGFNPH